MRTLPYSANSIRDGVGLIPKEELEPIVLAEDVHNFSALEGMIRVANAACDPPLSDRQDQAALR